MGALGINKDLEPLARRFRKAGGTVAITRSNHVRWTTPDGRIIRTGLTMSRATARAKYREIQRVLAETAH